MSQQVQAVAKTTEPNQYHLRGGGLSVSYYPSGTGPIVKGEGRVVFTYQDATQSRSFRETQARLDKAAETDLGLIVSVTLIETTDLGSTTFSLVVPPVVLPAELFGHAAIETIGITTLHHSFLVPIGHPQRASYTVTKLSGTASAGILPL